jgi:hypothetical protein
VTERHADQTGDGTTGTPPESAPRTATDATTTGAISGLGTGGLGSAGGTDTTPSVASEPRPLDAPDPSGSPLDDAVEHGDVDRDADASPG